MKSVTCILIAVPAAMALPQPQTFGIPESLDKRNLTGCFHDNCPLDDHNNYHQACERHDHTRFDGGLYSTSVWWQGGIHTFLDNWITGTYTDDGKSPDYWLQDMNDKWPAGGDYEWVCNNVASDHTCLMQGDCRDYFDMKVPQMFYINYAATKFHEVMTTMHEKLQDWAIETGFDADAIVDTFVDGDATAANPFAIISSAFGIASAATGNAGFGIASSTFGLVGAFYSTAADDPSGDVRESISDFFSKTADSIQNLLNDAFGAGDDYNIDELPAQTEHYYNKSPIGRFFADGKWLIYDVSSVLDPLIEAGNALMSSAVVISLLDNQGYFVFIDTETSEDDCHGESLTWMDGYCWSLVEDVGTSCITGITIDCQTDVTYITGERWEILTNPNGRYKLDPEEFFHNAYDCKKNHPDDDGKVDVSNLPYDGSFPECFYKIDVIKGSYDTDDGSGIDEEDL